MYLKSAERLLRKHGAVLVNEGGSDLDGWEWTWKITDKLISYLAWGNNPAAHVHYVTTSEGKYKNFHNTLTDAIRYAIKQEVSAELKIVNGQESVVAKMKVELLHPNRWLHPKLVLWVGDKDDSAHTMTSFWSEDCGHKLHPNLRAMMSRALVEPEAFHGIADWLMEHELSKIGEALNQIFNH